MADQHGKKFKTSQELFWAGEFGDEYVLRNQGDALRASNIALFSAILASTTSIRSLIEYGANIGVNLIALRHLLPVVELAAVEIEVEAGAIQSERAVIRDSVQPNFLFSKRLGFEDYHFGLMAAIPAVVAYNYFVRRIKVLSSEMEAFSNDFLNIVKRHFFK